MMHRSLLMLGIAACLSTGASAEDEPGHLHGPDGRHIAAPAAAASPGAVILSHHDLKITDTRTPTPSKDGLVLEGCKVNSIIHRKGDPNAVVHREKNAFEADIGVYGSHMTYTEPGEYVLVEEVTLPDGKSLTLQFPIWVPGPEATPTPAAGVSGLWLALGLVGVLILLALTFVLGRRSGRRAAGTIALLVVVALSSVSIARAEDEPGHMHGPDGRHIAAPPAAGGDSRQLRAYLGPNREIEAAQDRDGLRFRLTIENEEITPDPDVVSLDEDSAKTIGLELVTAEARPIGGGLSATGQVKASADGIVTVNSRVSGRLVQLPVRPGQEIREGAVVAVVDSAEVAQAQTALSTAISDQRKAEAARSRAGTDARRARLEVDEARAALDGARAQKAEALAEVDQARAGLDMSWGKVEASRSTLARQQQLAASGAFSQGPVEQARAALNSATGEVRAAREAVTAVESEYARLESGVRLGVTAAKDLEAARARMNAAKTRLSLAEQQVEPARAVLAREERILRENLRDAREVQAAQSDLDQALLGVKAAESLVAGRLKSVDAAEAKIAAQTRAITTAQARADSVASEVREADAEAARARQAVRAASGYLQLLGASPGGGNLVSIRAPISGRIQTRPATEGQFVASGEALATVVNTQAVWVEVDVFERDLPSVRVGQRVEIGVDAIPGRTLQGTISVIGGEVDPVSRAVRVRIVVANPRGVLKPNMHTRVVIASAGKSGVLAPIEAIQEHSGDQIVFVQVSAGNYRRRVVRTGPRLGDRAVIESGVEPGEKLVGAGSYQLLSRLRN